MYTLPEAHPDMASTLKAFFASELINLYNLLRSYRESSNLYHPSNLNPYPFADRSQHVHAARGAPRHGRDPQGLL